MPLIVTPRQLNLRGELYHQLGVMIAAGLPFRQALQHLEKNPPSLALREPVMRWQAELDKGLTITEALRQTGKWISSFDLALIDASERSGRLDACFKLLAVYYQERAQLARQMISDSLYPAFVFNFALLLFPAIGLLTNGNVHLFFWRVGVIAVPLYGGLFLLIFACQGRHGKKWRAVMETIFRRVPVLGLARQDLALARLAAALDSLLNAGVPIITAWELSAAASGSPALDDRVQSWRPRVESGGATYSEVMSDSKEFPELFRNLYHTGEVSGTLDHTLVRLHNLYQTEGLRRMRALSSWTPKIVYFGIMLFVAWKIISYYTGYFNELNQAIDFK